MSLPTWLSTKLRAPATAASLVAIAVVGVLADQVLRVGAFGLGTTFTIVCTAGALLWIGGLARWEARAACLIAVLFALWLTLRASPWLVWPDVIASIGLLMVAASLASRGSLMDLGAAEAAARTIHGLLHLALGVGFALQPLRGTRARLAITWPVIRGLLIAVPIVALLTGLLASADPVFASFFRINLDVGQLILDILFFLFGAIAMAGVLRIAAAEAVSRVDAPPWRLGLTEALVVVAALDIVFAMFATAQVVAVSSAGRQTLMQAGLTYAEYARSGFFQLLWVAGITLALLVVFSRITAFDRGRGRLAFRSLAGVAIALTLLIAYVASRRLSLYEEAYGFTMLRLYSHIFALWGAVVFILLAAEIAGLWSGRRWFVGATGATALVVILALNVVNPEALVVDLNTARAASTYKLDTDYLATLSSDATPALASARQRVPVQLSGNVARAMCSGSRSYTPAWVAINVADAAAASTRTTVGC